MTSKQTRAKTDHHRIRIALAKAGLSQAELARRLGVPRTSLSDWLSGRRPAPTTLVGSIEKELGASGCASSPQNRAAYLAIGLASFDPQSQLQLVHHEIHLDTDEARVRYRAELATRRAIATIALLQPRAPLSFVQDIDFIVQVEVIHLGNLTQNAANFLDSSVPVFEFLAERSRLAANKDPEFDFEHLE